MFKSYRYVQALTLQGCGVRFTQTHCCDIYICLQSFHAFVFKCERGRDYVWVYVHVGVFAMPVCVRICTACVRMQCASCV